MSAAAVLTVGVDYFCSLQAVTFVQGGAGYSFDSSTVPFAYRLQEKHRPRPPFCCQCDISDRPDALVEHSTVNHVYNGMAGLRRTRNELYGMMKALLSGNFAHLAAHVPEYVDFRRGDVRHSQADISRAARLLGYVPTHRIDDGMREAMDWYVHALPH